MLHIADNWYLESDPYCFILQEKRITPEINEKTNKPTKNAGQEYFTNQSYHATHRDVINKLIDIGLHKAIDGDAKVYFAYMDTVITKIDEILKVKRGNTKSN